MAGAAIWARFRHHLAPSGMVREGWLCTFQTWDSERADSETVDPHDERLRITPLVKVAGQGTVSPLRSN